jgi:acyl-homoserine-lactone acylase
LLNPECGFVFNTNNSEFFATEDDCNLDSMIYSRDMGLWYANNNRAHRLKELLESKPKFNFDEFKVIKFDQSLPKSGAFAISLKPLFERVDIVKYPDLAEIKVRLIRWDLSFKADNHDAALMHIAIHDIFKRFHWGARELEKPLELPDSSFADALRKSRDKLVKMFGTIDIPLGDYQRLIHGKVDLPLGGINDVLAATYTEEMPDGREKAIGGDTYIQLVKFNKTGLPYIESLLPLGNSCRPDSPHYTDQMELYSKQQTKVMTLDKVTIYKEAERIYHPKK